MFKVTLTIFAIFLMASAMITPEESLSALWQTWKATHNKYYSASEESHRFTVFQNNAVKVAQLNAEDSGAKFALNQFADLTSEEFKNKYTGGLLTEASENDELPTPEPITEPLAASVDWRTQGAVTIVKNQQTCGSYWAFAAVGAIEGLHVIQGGTLTAFSPQQMVDCSSSYGNLGCNGGLMTNAFDYSSRFGNQKNSEYPYVNTVQSCRYNRSKALRVISGYQNVAPSYTSLKSAVNGRPVAVGLQADQTSFQFYQSGVLSSGCGAALNHAGLVVGYHESQYWIVKNSWGTDWGMKGYIRIAMGSQNSGAGVCGINSQASYPIG